MLHLLLQLSLCFFFNDTATTEIYTLSLHDALPIYRRRLPAVERDVGVREVVHHQNIILFCQRDYFFKKGQIDALRGRVRRDRKSTRLNSSHQIISYAVFFLKKKNTTTHTISHQHHR